MGKWFSSLMIFGAGVAIALSLSTSPSSGQAQGPRLPRSADGHPLMNGIWQAMSTAYWDLEDHAARQGPMIALGAA